MKSILLKKLNTLLDVPFERWSENGISLKAVSANANGIVQSGILKDKTYFFRKHEFIDGAFTGKAWFVLEK